MTVTEVRSALLALAFILLVLAALEDLRSRTIPNRLAVAVFATGLLLGAISQPFTLWLNFLVALLILTALGAVSHLVTFGGGDIKLMSAATLLVPPPQIAGLLLAIALAGGLVSLVYLALGLAMRRQARPAQRPRNALARWWRTERRRITGSRTVPYALAIAGGSISYILAEWHRCLFVTSCSP